MDCSFIPKSQGKNPGLRYATPLGALKHEILAQNKFGNT